MYSEEEQEKQKVKDKCQDDYEIEDSSKFRTAATSTSNGKLNNSNIF